MFCILLYPIHSLFRVFINYPMISSWVLRQCFYVYMWLQKISSLRCLCVFYSLILNFILKEKRMKNEILKSTLATCVVFSTVPRENTSKSIEYIIKHFMYRRKSNLWIITYNFISWSIVLLSTFCTYLFLLWLSEDSQTYLKCIIYKMKILFSILHSLLSFVISLKIQESCFRNVS